MKKTVSDFVVQRLHAHASRKCWQGDPEAMRTIKATMREYWASATA